MGKSLGGYEKQILIFVEKLWSEEQVRWGRWGTCGEQARKSYSLLDKIWTTSHILVGGGHYIIKGGHYKTSSAHILFSLYLGPIASDLHNSCPYPTIIRGVLYMVSLNIELLRPNVSLKMNSCWIKSLILKVLFPLWKRGTFSLHFVEMFS